MSMVEGVVSLNVDKELVSKVLERQIQAAIVANLGNPEALIEKAVHIALSKKVNSEGREDQYSSYNTHDFLEVLAAKNIRESATSALKEWLEKNNEKVKAAVMRELERPERKKSIAKAYADEIERSLKCNWNMSCNISFKQEP